MVSSPLLLRGTPVPGAGFDASDGERRHGEVLHDDAVM